MKAAPATPVKTTTLDLKRALLETFKINERANQLLLVNVSDDAWRAPTPTGKGRTIADIAAHIHNVRLMWLSAADKSAKLPTKLDKENSTRKEAIEALQASAVAMQKLLEAALEHPEGKVPNFKPNVVAFIGYLVSHDSHHRGQISMLARQVGHPIEAKASFGLWEWGTLWKACGTSK